MRYGCPNTHCNNFNTKDSIIRDGKFKRANDSRIIQRYKCKSCGVRFSNSTFSLAKNQKKRRVNQLFEKLFSSNVSMRRSARIIGVTRKTAKRKFEYLSLKAVREQENRLKARQHRKVTKVQLDDLITIEHTKMKPLSVSIAVEEKTGVILGAQVSEIPAFGHLAEISRKKYGRRSNNHLQGLHELFQRISKSIADDAQFKTDMHKNYPLVISSYFPGATHKTYKGRKACVAGQGELKKGRFDPLFSINHACAMLRANICRLVRKSWCTTKDPEMLQKHLNIYINYHNKFHLTP